MCTFRFAENSPEWNMAMIQYLIDMKNHGHKIKEIETSKVKKTNQGKKPNQGEQA